MKTLEELAQLREQMKAKMAIRTEEGKLRVVVARVLPLEEAAEAWRLSQTGHTRGKIVLSVS